MSSQPHQPKPVKTPYGAHPMRQESAGSPPIPTRHAILLATALDYAAHGLYIVPLHEPLFDTAGNLTGCTCEAYKRSEKYLAWLHLRGQAKRFDPNYKCRTPGKHPRLSDWETLASKDPDQVRAWWQRWPTANIGLAVGKSGLVTFDLDSYKEVYGDDSDLFTQADKQTVTQISGKGGEHLVYHMPTDRAYTNANNTLPKGIDIRGVGGMQVLAPSLHPCGRQYEWEEGYSILECDPRPLPAALQAILDAAQQNSASPQAVTFTTPTTERPDLIRWQLSKAVRELINAPAPSGQRSEADMKVVTALCYAGATNDDILAVFQHYPIGAQGKYAEAGDAYLSHTVGKARAYAAAHPRPDVGATADNLLLWVRTHSFAEYIDPKFLASDGTYRTDPTDTKTADAILCEMKAKGRSSINIGKKRLAKLAGLGSCNTALKALTRLNGWLFDVTIDPQHGAQVALCEQGRLQQIDPLLGNSIVYKRDQSSANDVFTPPINEYSPHKADEPFLIGTSKIVRERIKDIAQAIDTTPAQAKEEYTFASLGEAGLRVLDALQRAGDMTAQELADETGKKLSGIRAAVRKLAQHGIVEAEREGARGPKVYSLAPDHWRRIDEIAPNLRTYTSASRRENKRLEAAQQWAAKGIKEAEQAHNTEQAQRIERRFAQMAKERIPHLARLHPDLAPADIKRLAYEIAAYKSTPEAAQQIRTYRTQATDDHRDDVRIIRELANHAINQFVADGLRKPTTRMVVDAIMCYGTFDEKMVRNVIGAPLQVGAPVLDTFVERMGVYA